MLKKISQLKNNGVFRDFLWPTDLPPLGKYNVFYGWNGSGKTTLSRVLRDLELRRVPTHGEVVIETSENQIGSRDFPGATLPIRVFNRDFVNESIFPSGGGDVPPIFIIGKESVEKKKKADHLQREKDKAEADFKLAEKEKEDAENALDRYCQEGARKIKDLLRSSRQNRFNNFNKSDFRAEAERMSVNDQASLACLETSQKEALLAQLTETQKPKIPTVNYQPPDYQALADGTNALLEKTVVSAVIDSLKDDPEVGDWVNAGLRLHKTRKNESCLFCEQPLPAERLASLEAHFSAAYEQFLQEINEQIDYLESAAEQASSVYLPSRGDFFEDIAKEYDDAKHLAERDLSDIILFVKALGKDLNAKLQKAFEVLSVKVAVPSTDGSGLVKVAEIIRKHNAASDNFGKRVEDAREQLALDGIASDIEEFNRLRNEIQETSDRLRVATEKFDELAAAIRKIYDEISGHQRSAESLNHDLRQYLGHGELQLTVKDTGYAITRNGEPAEMLSEGEMTAIALIYFLKSLEDRNFDLLNGVVVLDDPVSSLDGNALFLAFGLIRSRTDNAGQFLILTHDFGLFRNIRNWFHKKTGQGKKDRAKKPAKLYMLECTVDEGVRSTSLSWVDPLLENYESEYHYLFAKVYYAAFVLPAKNLEDYYHLPNVARRLLEGFLAFKVPHRSGDLYRSLESVSFDENKKLRLLRFLHTNSHGADIVPGHDLSVLSECTAVLEDLLSLLESTDELHYAAMVQLIKDQQSG